MNKPRRKPVPTAKRMSDYRDRLRAAGLRPVQLWLYDTRSPAFIAKARKEARAIAAHDRKTREFDSFLEAAFDNMTP